MANFLQPPSLDLFKSFAVSAESFGLAMLPTVCPSIAAAIGERLNFRRKAVWRLPEEGLSMPAFRYVLRRCTLVVGDSVGGFSNKKLDGGALMMYVELEAGAPSGLTNSEVKIV